MDKRNKVVLGSAVAAALATSALVAGMAFAAPKVATAPVKAPAAQSQQVEAPEAAATGADTDNVQSGDQNGADDATEPKGVEEAKGAANERDGVNHEFNGEEVGNNGNGIPDANEASETK